MDNLEIVVSRQCRADTEALCNECLGSETITPLLNFKNLNP